jgi:hypothetical protein
MQFPIPGKGEPPMLSFIKTGDDTQIDFHKER